MSKGSVTSSNLSSTALIQDVAWRTWRKRWTIGTSGGWGSGKSVLAVRRDDDDDDGNKNGSFLTMFNAKSKDESLRPTPKWNFMKKKLCYGYDGITSLLFTLSFETAIIHSMQTEFQPPQFYSKQFSLTWVHSLIIKNISI